MKQITNSKRYDLEARTYNFAKSVRLFVNKIPKNIVNTEDCRQLIRAGGSIGANYIEANESLSKKDFAMRIKICKKEAKESSYWINLLSVNFELEKEKLNLFKEAIELMKIFGAILEKIK